MQFVTCIVSLAPLRKEPAHKSEMVSQLLFGECATVIGFEKDFVQIKCLYDGYEGWCTKSQLHEVDEKFYNSNHKLVTAQPISYATCNDKDMLMVAGSFIGCFENGKLTIGKHIFTLHPQPLVSQINEDGDIFDAMQHYLNTSYLWGGKSIFGIDCSGFVQQVYKMLDIKMPRDAYQQAEKGEVVGFLSETKIGDLAFFDNPEGKIVHVGILLNNQNIMHSMGKVRVDKIDTEGIINTDTGERTHKLRLIKRMLK